MLKGFVVSIALGKYLDRQPSVIKVLILRHQKSREAFGRWTKCSPAASQVGSEEKGKTSIAGTKHRGGARRERERKGDL